MVTGTFNTAWQIKGAPVIPTIPRKDIDNPVFTSRKAPKREKPIYTSLVKSVYVGNKADYAGFVINKEKSPYEPNQMYAECLTKEEQMVQGLKQLLDLTTLIGTLFT